jgi:hypothetical protein
MISSLTRIGTVEGFGSMIRAVQVDRLQSHFDESISAPRSSTSARLFEAHARDEAGWDDEGGPQADVVRGARHRVRGARHRDMTQTMLVRMGIAAPAASHRPPERTPRRSRCAGSRSRSRDGDDAAAWWGCSSSRFRRSTRSRGPKRCCSDSDLVAGAGSAADLVRYVRADETPHVDYLRTALTEMRDRPFGESGRRIPGAEVIGTLWIPRSSSRWARTARASCAPRRPRSSTRSPRIRGGPSCSKASIRSARSRSREARIMKFGIFYEHQLPRPWDTDSEYRLIQDALEQIEYADRIGIDYAWEVEHHFLEEYSHSSAPEVFLAAASQRTERIRLGHGIVQTPPAFNHPARVAERISMLDLVLERTAPTSVPANRRRRPSSAAS